MTTEHKIRIAVRGLIGETREHAILELRKRPAKIEQAQKVLLLTSGKRRKRILGAYRTKYPIAFCVRLTAEQYLRLRDSAKFQGISVSRLVRERLG